MLKRLILRKLTMLAIVLTSLPVSQAQIARPDRDENRHPRLMQISVYKDDPFVRESIVERMDPAKFDQDKNGHLSLWSDQVLILDESVIYRQDKNTGEYKPFVVDDSQLTIVE